MSKKILITILALIMFATFISVAKATIEASIEIKDSGGNIISGTDVLPGTVAYVNGTYEDLDGNAPASASMKVYYDDDLSSGPGWQFRETLFTGTVNDGQSIVKTYTMTELGYYQFRWRCEVAGTSGLSILCVLEVDLALTQVLVIPEPGTLAGLITALSAFGLLAVKRIRTK